MECYYNLWSVITICGVKSTICGVLLQSVECKYNLWSVITICGVQVQSVEWKVQSVECYYNLWSVSTIRLEEGTICLVESTICGVKVQSVEWKVFLSVEWKLQSVEWKVQSVGNMHCFLLSRLKSIYDMK